MSKRYGVILEALKKAFNKGYLETKNKTKKKNKL